MLLYLKRTTLQWSDSTELLQKFFTKGDSIIIYVNEYINVVIRT